MNMQDITTYEQENASEEKRSSNYLGQMVTKSNYKLFTREERGNAQRELKAYLKGRPSYKAKVFIPEVGGGGKFAWIEKQVNRN